jgi:hypothetical protein
MAWNVKKRLKQRAQCNSEDSTHGLRKMSNILTEKDKVMK